MKNKKLKTVTETTKLGERLGRLLGKGDVAALIGELGSGKTTMIKGIAKGIGVKNPERVNSPTFVIQKEYKGRVPLYHFDVYRLDHPDEMEQVGYREYFYGEGVSVVEWADKIRELLPDEHLEINLSVKSGTERECELKAFGERYKRIMEKLK